MKKVLSIIFTFSLLGNALFAQNADFKHTFSVQYGASIFNFAKGDITGKLTPEQTDSIKFSSAKFSHIPTIGIAWDYGVKKWFSIGVAASYNQAKAAVTALEVRNNKGTFDKLGDFSLTVPRTTVATRLLFHYGNKGRIDCYSGFRFGVGIWSVKTSQSLDKATLSRAIDGIVNELGDNVAATQGLENISTTLKTKTSFALFQAQLILFGIRGYVTENIGISSELAVGSPYFFSLGANYRF